MGKIVRTAMQEIVEITTSCSVPLLVNYCLDLRLILNYFKSFISFEQGSELEYKFRFWLVKTHHVVQNSALWLVSDQSHSFYHWQNPIRNPGVADSGRDNGSKMM